MAWQRVGLVVAGPHAQALADALEESGAVSVELTDADAGTAAEQAVFGEPGAETQPWPRCRVSALFAEDSDVSAALDAALAASGNVALEGACVDRLQDEDWVALTQRQFQPIRAGERLWIVPTWHEPPAPDAINVVLDPGAAFGTGSHPTTRLCLAWLERNVRGGDSVLDYGCGSGILAIAALKLGAARALAVDVDPRALEAAGYNSRSNGVALELRDAQRPIPETFRITVANILANPLRVLAPLIAARTCEGGSIALSGILEEQARDVIAAYAPWARLDVAAEDGGWVLLAGRKAP
ncbi:MAG TPA: 50S ribosomal protein L11 methyltransferase [Usitatibacter sp.]|nr:50S ribosomal protein L11 methyltransferase [Usitatibacter sp.]